jgi:hypothetical protein
MVSLLVVFFFFFFFFFFVVWAGTPLGVGQSSLQPFMDVDVVLPYRALFDIKGLDILRLQLSNDLADVILRSLEDSHE